MIAGVSVITLLLVLVAGIGRIRRLRGRASSQSPTRHCLRSAFRPC